MVPGALDASTLPLGLQSGSLPAFSCILGPSISASPSSLTSTKPSFPGFPFHLWDFKILNIRNFLCALTYPVLLPAPVYTLHPLLQRNCPSFPASYKLPNPANTLQPLHSPPYSRHFSVVVIKRFLGVPSSWAPASQHPTPIFLLIQPFKGQVPPGSALSVCSHYTQS